MFGANPVVLDGGLSTYLESVGYDVSTALWSGALLDTHPAAIEQAHREFFAAGAELATTASYQLSFSGCTATGMSRRRAEKLMRASVSIAERARRGFLADHPDSGRRLWVAASIGPYGARLANGAEYTGRYGLSPARLKARHRPEFDVLASSGADLLACETIPDLDEAEALAELIDEHGRPAWMSFTARGFRTAAGQRLDEAFALAGEVDNVVAVGVNCCDPGNLADVIRLARESSGKPVVVYPNSGEAWDDAARHWNGPSRYRPGDAADWVAAGASAVGGCCRVHPQEIRAVATALAR